MKQLIDLNEIAEILHVSPERADELAEGVVFPPSVGDWGGERLWRRADVELWARAIPPRAWPERTYGKRLIHWTEMPRGGHFAALESPELLVQDVRTFFRKVRDRR